MTTLEIIVIVQSAILVGGPIVGNLLAWILRVTGHPKAAAAVDWAAPFARRLGMAKTAKDIIDLSVDLAHEVTTKPPNSVSGVTPGSAAIVNVDIDPNPSPGVAPRESIVLPIVGGVLLAFAAVGCQTIPPEVARAIETFSEGAGKTDRAARGAYAVALDVCETDACAARIKAAFEPLKEGLKLIRDAWCTIAPQTVGCDVEKAAPR